MAGLKRITRLCVILGAGCCISAAAHDLGPAHSELRRAAHASPADLDAATPVGRSQAVPAVGGQYRYTLLELEGLREGNHAEYARTFFKDLAGMGWPKEILERLKEAGVRVSFEFPHNGEPWKRDSYAGIYDFESKTLHIWEMGVFRTRAAGVAELTHALSDLSQPDDPTACHLAMTQVDEDFKRLWQAYLQRVNEHLGVGKGDDKLYVYPEDFLSHLRWHGFSIDNWLGKDPILGGQGYLNPEEYWMEAVILFFEDSKRLRKMDAALADYVSRKLEDIGKNGLKEKVGQTPDVSRCFKKSVPSRMDSPGRGGYNRPLLY